MKLTLHFDLPEDRDAYRMAFSGPDYYFSLLDLDNWLRNEIKYREDLSDETRGIYERVREVMGEVMADHGVSLDDVS